MPGPWRKLQLTPSPDDDVDDDGVCDYLWVVNDHGAANDCKDYDDGRNLNDADDDVDGSVKMFRRCR